jgi:hypothetical protein
VPTDYQKAIDNIKLSEDFKERAIRLLPLAKDFVINKDPEDVLEYTKSMDPRDAYVMGLIIGRILINSK